jgi:hypothetical protein
MRIQRLLNYHVRPKVHGGKGCRLALPARGAGLQGAVPPRSVKCHLRTKVSVPTHQSMPRHAYRAWDILASCLSNVCYCLLKSKQSCE